MTEAAYTAKKQSFLSKDYKMSHGKLNQYMASFLQETMLKKIELNEIDLAKLFTKEEYDTCVNKNVDFFKMLAAKTLKDYSINDTKKDEIELLKKISQKTSMVFTTNYDLFLEKEIFDNFKVYGGQDKYYFRTNNGYGELFKIHGSVLEPNGMIITANDYERFDEKLQ